MTKLANERIAEKRSTVAFAQISPPWYHGIGRSRWLRGWRGLALLVAVVAAVAIGVGWNWLAGIGALSILITALPCLAMCALGLCMQRVVGRGIKPLGSDDWANPRTSLAGGVAHIVRHLAARGPDR